MKSNLKALSLMALLAAGVAGAQGTTTVPGTTVPSDGTLAGTTINNTATATFTDPTTGSAATPVNSNTVTTTVLPKPGFDIVYREGTDGTEGTTTGGNTAGSAQSTATLAPGQSLNTAYYVVNNGNTSQTITLTSDTTGSTSGTPTVAYYLDTDGDGLLSTTEAANPVTQVTLPYDDPATTADEGRVAIIQVLTAPTTAAAGTIAAATPVGTGEGFDTTTNTVIASQTESTTTLGLQFAAITILTPSISNDPSSTTTTTPITTTTTIPNGTPTGSTVTGYTDPAGTPVAVNGDQQVAYPKADDNTTADVVTFTNTVNNTGTQNDPVNLFPTDSTGNPIGTVDSATGIFTNIPGLPAGTTVQFLDMSGNPLPIGPDGLPVLQTTAGTETNYQTKVTYPDSNSVTNPEPITVLIGVDSGLDAGTTANDTTTDIIYPPAAQFGDATAALGTEPIPSPIQSGAPDSTVYFPMDVTNQGEYADSYTLSGTVQIPLTDGTTATVPVVYYADTNGNGVLDPAELTAGAITNTGAVQPDSEVKLIAAVTIPTKAAATVVNSEPALQQTATGDYSTIVMTDTNDRINVTPSGSLAIAKFIQGGNGANTYAGLTADTGYATGTNSALPGAALNYEILSKNNYNVAIQNFALGDTLDKNLNYVSATCSIVLSDGALQACTVAAPVANTDGTTSIATTAVTLPQGATMKLFINTTIK